MHGGRGVLRRLTLRWMRSDAPDDSSEESMHGALRGGSSDGADCSVGFYFTRATNHRPLLSKPMTDAAGPWESLPLNGDSGWQPV